MTGHPALVRGMEIPCLFIKPDHLSLVQFSPSINYEVMPIHLERRVILDHGVGDAIS
ncbi:hypothetical protein DPMN_053049 [Dreissena polymorpha]|uniref:Uncharacterized protein n=1 Tax=Dreissena polymorpha TaxID=45954 RepID=A0A9D4CM00_DREPO|nr:hypothetical protein DPMN_053049 [Dreissena polymorpha]